MSQAEGSAPTPTRSEENVPRFFCGIDWSEGWNDVAVIDAQGAVVAQARILETPEGHKQVLSLLSGLSTSQRHSRRQVPIAIETGRSLLVAALLKARQPVIAINPTIVANYRGRVSPAKKRKSDRSDAQLLANIIRTDGHLHRPLPAHSEQLLALTELSRAHSHAVRQQQYYLRRLRSQLRVFYPAALQAWASLPKKILRPEARAMLHVAPTPAQAAKLKHRQIADTLAAAGRTRLIADEADRLRELFRQPQLRQRPAVEEAMGTAMLSTLACLDRADRLAATLEAEATEAFMAHPQAKIYCSFPGVGPVLGVRLLAEIGDDPNRFISGRGLRAYAGVAPLTWSSGGSRSVTHRKIANKRLKVTCHLWAFASLTRSPGARAHYDRRREVGDRYAAALRNLSGRLLSCLHHCLAHDLLYQEEAAFPPTPLDA
ncbi:IS110 family transposase [Nonomuraea fuscirosea]|uniref:IS110 family transposase n=1 Tax=Nonomuraea fuscirosea TaxID=1291556 RepID=UPI0033FF7E50